MVLQNSANASKKVGVYGLSVNQYFDCHVLTQTCGPCVHRKFCHTLSQRGSGLRRGSGARRWSRSGWSSIGGGGRGWRYGRPARGGRCACCRESFGRWRRAQRPVTRRATEHGAAGRGGKVRRRSRSNSPDATMRCRVRCP